MPVPRSPRIPLLGALASLVALVLTGLLTLQLPVVQRGDAATLRGFLDLNRPAVTSLLDVVAHLADPLPYAAIGFGLAGVALLRKRPRVAVTIVGLLVATGWTTRTLKPLLATPRYDQLLGIDQVDAASWPSGHATASMTLALCAMLAVSARARPAAAVIGAAFAISVSYSLLALGWHFPSDVFGGFLVASTWTLLAVAGLVALERRWPTGATREAAARRADALAPVGVATAAVGVLGGAVLLARPEGVLRFAVDHSTFVAGAAAIALLAVLLALGFVRGVRPA